MTLQDILERLIEDGYENCTYDRCSKNCIIVGKLGEVELAYGEAMIFDRKHPWPGYGDHACFKKIDDLFADIHATWPIPKKEVEETPCVSSNESLPSSSVEDAKDHVTKDESPASAGCLENVEPANENH